MDRIPGTLSLLSHKAPCTMSVMWRPPHSHPRPSIPGALYFQTVSCLWSVVDVRPSKVSRGFHRSGGGRQSQLHNDVWSSRLRGFPRLDRVHRCGTFRCARNTGCAAYGCCCSRTLKQWDARCTAAQETQGGRRYVSSRASLPFILSIRSALACSLGLHGRARALCRMSIAWQDIARVHGPSKNLTDHAAGPQQVHTLTTLCCRYNHRQRRGSDRGGFDGHRE